MRYRLAQSSTKLARNARIRCLEDGGDCPVSSRRRLSTRSHPMRRNRVRLVLALVATTILTACADLSTGPQAPTGPRFQTEEDSLLHQDSVLSRTSNSQGSQV